MRILVDADACPGRDIIERASKESQVEVIMFCDLNHVIKSSYSKVVYADSGFQSVDMKLANEAQKGDIVVTQDFGVATMALSKRAYAIGPKGYIYNDDNIDKLLFERHISSKVRRAGGKTSNAKKRSAEDDKRLYENLKFLIEKSLSAIDYI
ncbi:YaiI/YqxD family protein [Haloimpatiens lingqiaonensis]|uniref:YaiI/YqxD family protein n=1 Tax=Haloimpatiens lingqiaonensis TaxID=1380675 RepID=UPI0010FE6756|nr:YaiI/YqxD family protein [Haloimpatiens lingqiaonensis]